jgi:periplasmic divalent cation tolerance protein
MSTEYCLVLCACPDAETARIVAEALVMERRAACVNILPGLTSVYPWQGAIETAEEHLLLIKTETGAFDDLDAFIKARHPYEIPEIIAIPIKQGSADYLDWMTAWLHRKS